MLSTCIAFDLSASIFPSLAILMHISDIRACPDMSHQQFQVCH
jgi:hypothetical protein